jgi:CheY-like chemotaxis protein
MTLRTCLLVTDDPDDHQAISEALSQISEKTIVLNILDSQKALTLLKESTYRPDYIFLDLSMLDNSVAIVPGISVMLCQPFR